MYPFIRITDQILIPTYILILSLVFSVGIIWVVKRCQKFNMDRSIGLDICLAFMLGGFAGSRLFHVFYEEPLYYWENPINILKVWQGGFVFYGGVIGAVSCILIVMKKHNASFKPWADLFAPVNAGGYGLGRLACFFNNCCYGKVCALPWAVHFRVPGETFPLGRHPATLYAFFWEISILGFLLFLENKRIKNPKSIPVGQIFFIWTFLHGVGRLMMEYFRDDPRGPELLSLSVSSWISLVIIAGSLYAFSLVRKASSNSN